MKTQKLPTIEEFIKDKLPQKNFLSHDWRNFSLEFNFAHILWKSGVTELRPSHMGIHDNIHFASLVANKNIEIQGKNPWKSSQPLLWELADYCKLKWCGGAAGTDYKRNPYMHLCLSDQRGDSLYIGPWFLSSSNSQEIGMRIYSYFSLLMDGYYDRQWKPLEQ